MNQVLRGAGKKPVLGAEQRRQLTRQRGRKQIGGVLQVRIIRRGITQPTDTPAAQDVEAIVAENIESGSHR